MAGSLGILAPHLRRAHLQLCHEAQHLHCHPQGGRQDDLNQSIVQMTTESTPMWPLQDYSPISWESEDRALVLSAFFYGYVVFQVPFASC